MKSLKEYKSKLDYRLGYCIFGCLFTIGVVAIIFGLLQESAHDELTSYLQATRQLIIDSASLSTTTSESEPPEFFATTETEFFDDFNITTSMSETTEATTTTTTTTEPQPVTCLGSEHIESPLCLTPAELQDDYDNMTSSHIALWNLAILNLIIALFVIFFTVVFHRRITESSHFKLFYRGALLLALFFMAIQLIFLISPLLNGAAYYPYMVDKLFEDKLPRDESLLEKVESRFACQFRYIAQLVELNLQRPCGPQIKNALLPPFAVVLLIFLDLAPFVFIVFTYAWDAYIKDAKPVKNARMRIELNNQRSRVRRAPLIRGTSAAQNDQPGCSARLL